MASCSMVNQTLDSEENKDQTLENVITLLLGFVILLIIVTIITIIKYRKIIIKRLCCQCYCIPVVCVCCYKRAVKGEDHQGNYLIHSWEEPEPEVAAKEGYNEEEDPEESTVLSNPNFSEFTLHMDDDAADENETDHATFNTTSTEKDPIVPVVDNPDIATLAETSFTDENWQQLELEAASTTKLSFVDTLVAPKEKQQEMIYGCEKHAIVKLEAGFYQNYTSFVLLLVEVLGTKLVAAKKASREWMMELLDVCRDLTSNGHNLRDISAFMAQLLDNISASLKKTDLSAKQTGQMMAGFEEDLGKFEMEFSIMYLKEVEKLRGRTDLKEILIDKLTRNTQELLEEMAVKQKSHTKLLRKIQMGLSVQSFPAQTQAKLASDIKTMWQLTIKNFKRALDEQKLILKGEINHRMDRNSPEHKVKGNFQEKIEMLVKRDLKMAEFIDLWCSELRNVLNAEYKQDYIEVNFTTAEFNALMEMLGMRYLQQGIKAEKELLSQLTAPGSEDLISQLEKDHSNQKVSLRSMRQKQESELRTIMNATSLESHLIEPYYFNDLKTNKNLIQGVLEIQVDLSEVEQRSFREKFTARLSSYEVQFELEKLKHERRLRNDIRTKTMQKELGVSTSSSKKKVAIGLTHEEKASHSKAIEDTRSKLVTSLHSTEDNLELLFHQQIEKIRGTHEMDINLVGKQERALNVLKSKLLEKISNSSEQDTGERLLNEYHINLKVLDQEIEKSRLHQEQVLQQKIQSRKLEKIEEEKNLKQASRTSPLRVGSAKRFAANCLISLLMDVRHKNSLKKMDDYNTLEGEKLKSKLKRRYFINTKLGLQLHEREMIMKLASALNMSKGDLEKELKDSIPDEVSTDKETAGLLLSKSIIGLFDNEDPLY